MLTLLTIVSGLLTIYVVGTFFDSELEDDGDE